MDLLSCDMDLEKLSQKKVKPFTWLIYQKEMEGLDVVYNCATGFAINVDKNAMGIDANDVVLMTCAHTFQKSSEGIKARRSDDEDVFFEAGVHDIQNSWDLLLLTVKGVEQSSISYGEFADDGSIAGCEKLLHVGHVGHSIDFEWSTFVGRAAYPCLNISDSDIDKSFEFSKSCGSFNSKCLTETPDFRRMGHVYNQLYFDSQPTHLKFPFEKKLHALIPIIQCAGFSGFSGFSGWNGCFGGPVVNLKGKIVGMMSSEHNGCQIAIHVSLLKTFVRYLSNKVQGSSEEKEKGKQVLTLRGE